jgi:hypothetical protein
MVAVRGFEIGYARVRRCYGVVTQIQKRPLRASRWPAVDQLAGQVRRSNPTDRDP